MSTVNRGKIGFRRVDTAAIAYNLEGEDLWQVCIYPGAGQLEWGRFIGEDELSREIKDAVIPRPSSSVTAIFGPPSSGKTVQLLVLGHLWEGQPSSTGRSWLGVGKSPERKAFYAKATQLDVDGGLRLVESQIDSECLWLVDDVHSALDTAIEFIRGFKEEREDFRLQERSHALVLAFTGWSLPKDLTKHRPLMKRLGLTPELIRRALQAKEFQVPEQKVLEEIACLPAVGLKQILRHPQRLTEPTKLQTAFVEELVDRLPQSDRPQLYDELCRLARLRFLAVPFGPITDIDLVRRMVTLQRRGLIVLDMNTYTAELPDDDLAQVLLAQELRSVSATELVSRFLTPVKDAVANSLNKGHLTFTCVVLRGLRTRLREELCNWVGRSQDNGHSSLLVDFLSDSCLLNLLGSALQREGADVGEVARILAVIAAAQICEQWAKETAQALVDRRFYELRKGILKGDLESWRAGDTLNRIADDTRLNPSLRRALESPALAHSLALLGPAERGRVLTRMYYLDPERANRFMISLLPMLRQEIEARSPSGLWGSLNTLARINPHLAVQFLAELPESFVSKAILRAPKEARRFFSFFNPRKVPAERREIMVMLARALHEEVVQSSDVQMWSSPHDTSSFIELALELGVPKVLEGQVIQTVVTNLVGDSYRYDSSFLSLLCRPVARRAKPPSLVKALADRLEGTIIEQIEPMNDRIHALAMLDRSRAIPLVGRILDGVAALPADPVRYFGAFWNALIILPKAEQDVLQRHTRDLVTKRKALFSSNRDSVFTLLALSGLCSFIIGEPPPIVSLHLETVPPGKPSSPRLLACQLYALSKRSFGPMTVEFGYLRWLGEALCEPAKEFVRRWHHSTPSARHTALRLISDSISLLRSRTETVELAAHLACTAASSELDAIWDDDVIVRLETVSSYAEPDEVCKLIERVVPMWVEKCGFIRTMRLVNIVRHVYELTVTCCPRCMPQAAELLKVVLGRQLPFDVREEFTQKENTLAQQLGGSTQPDCEI
jgi:hypothetical protein